MRCGAAPDPFGRCPARSAGSGRFNVPVVDVGSLPLGPRQGEDKQQTIVAPDMMVDEPVPAALAGSPHFRELGLVLGEAVSQ